MKKLVQTYVIKFYLLNDISVLNVSLFQN